MCALLFTTNVLMVLVISSTATASKPNTIVVLGGTANYKPPSSIVNVAEEVVSVKTAEKLSFADVKLHTSEKIREKQRIFDAKKANSLTPSIQTENTPLRKRISRSFHDRVESTVHAIKGAAGKQSVKFVAGTSKNSAKLINERKSTSVGKPANTNTNANTNTIANGYVVDEKLARVARPLKTSVRTEAQETLTHKEMHYEYTSVYPPTCPCMMGTGLKPVDCWYYTDKTNSKCEARQCKQSWVCVVGGETTGTTCMRKKSFTKIVPNEGTDTCTTKDHITYSYVPYS